MIDLGIITDLERGNLGRAVAVSMEGCNTYTLLLLRFQLGFVLFIVTVIVTQEPIPIQLVRIATREFLNLT